MTLAQAFGRAIRERRHSFPRMTLRELSERTGISLSLLSNYEQGRRSPSVGALARLVTELGLDVNAIMRAHRQSSFSDDSSRLDALH